MPRGKVHLEKEALLAILADMGRQRVPEVVFGAPLTVGDVTVIPVANVSCSVAGGGPATLASLRFSPCAVIVLGQGEPTVLPIPSPGQASDRLAHLVSSLLAEIWPPFPGTGKKSAAGGKGNDKRRPEKEQEPGPGRAPEGS